ncbi:MAG: rod shape-determining protein RodA [Gammaproteobacteria bacterium]|jgi:rod shape determining protein RodA|nr:rod shape-determining protein RodA [Gammaproteobacteria bacterium]MBT3489209.1 rod shape-determining protein RodA [Gammaproteobacteria bacterium]MBT3719537.1 rod shape-determining protein RodA [Gammaproteobacteria bacterium]MBT3845380.1 rod shape-determining protein RodA [Gammaproteobacteria bacterium]MBT3892482.1 rod shape-determining protein RodA [Gammaproteobacteria bacterium]
MSRVDHTQRKVPLSYRLHIDLPLLTGLFLLSLFGLLVIYSAGGEDIDMLSRQFIRVSIAFTVLFIAAQTPPHWLKIITFWLFVIGLLMLFAVPFIGETHKGAQRWLNFGVILIQPSEMMKLIIPMMVAAYLSEMRLPPTPKHQAIAALLIIVPVLLIAKQPDLGTSLLIASSGFFVLFLAGISWRIIGGMVLSSAALLPLLWFYLMKPYQKQRVLTFLNPESDPRGTGYHIIQSKIAIGSGGGFGKGWLNGTQSQLEFLPERHTDFIFAVLAEEFGLLGVLILFGLYLFIIFRGLYIASQAQETYTRLLAGGITMIFFTYFMVNVGMVSGLLPVVGLPLPMVSYGGTSMVTIMAAFGILMSIHTHRRLLNK